MPDDQNTTQNPISEENSIPPSPQEPTEPTPINTTYSEPSEALPDAPESSPNDFSVKSNDIPLSNSTPMEAENESKTEEKQALNKPNIEPNLEPILEPIQTPEPETAQTPVSEPLNSTNEPLGEQVEIEVLEVKPEPTREEVKQTETKPISEFKPISTKPSQKDLWQRFLNKVQIGKRKKLDKIMALFLKKSKITNDEVEKFLHVSDATATRYLSQLEKENKIKQVGKTGHAVSYSRI